MWHFTLLRFTQAIHYSLPFTFIFCSQRFYYARPLISCFFFFFGPVYFFSSFGSFVSSLNTYACWASLPGISPFHRGFAKSHAWAYVTNEGRALLEAVVRFLSPQTLHPTRKSDWFAVAAKEKTQLLRKRFERLYTLSYGKTHGEQGHLKEVHTWHAAVMIRNNESFLVVI